MRRGKSLVFVLGVLVLALSSPARQRRPGEDTKPFLFQSNFWVNLHLFLRAEARRQSVGSPLLLPDSSLREDERSAWDEARDAYTPLAKLNLIFDERLIRINNALSRAGDVQLLPSGTVEPDVLAVLNAAAPVYRSHLWDQHRAANEKWITDFSPMVLQHAVAVTSVLAAAYQVKWPSDPILVDLACESGPTLAYTTGGRPGTAGHTVIAPTKASDPDVAFEIVFHEASHTVDGHIMQMVDDEAARQHVKADPELWHTIIFYTAGEVVRRELGRQNDPTYKPYANRVDLYQSAGWQKLQKALETDWQPYLDRKVDLKTAMRDVVRDASESGP